MAPFDSLTLAFEAWFDKPLGDLPEGLRLRAEAELMPLRWEDLSPDQRRSVALQLDYQHDPATAQDQQFWWDHFQRQDDLKAQIAQWEDAAAPTAAELALRETRLIELRQELARMEGLARRARSDYFPKRDSKCETSPDQQRSAVRYVAYPKAMAQLKERLNATPEELAAWIWLGPEEGGIVAYVNANELDPPPRFQFELGTGNGEDHDYVSPLMACWFLEDEIAEFHPADRYITGEALIKRWAERPGLKAEAWVRAKIQESRLSDLHPLYGGTRATSEDEFLPPMTTGLFRLSEVEAIESEDFPVAWDEGVRSHERLDSSPERETEVGAAPPAVAPVPVVMQSPGSPDSRADMLTATKTPADKVVSADPCEVFRAMQNLSADELTITFVGDRSDCGLAANNLLEISARKTVRRVALASLGLADRRQGGANNQAGILLSMATGRRPLSSPVNAKKMTRLRDAIRIHLGLDDDPFQPYRKHEGWVPRFKLVDKRGAADERAKREGERRTESLDTVIERQASLQRAWGSHRYFEAEGDEADAWLQQHDRDDSA
jgi:hypothetical protein